MVGSLDCEGLSVGVVSIRVNLTGGQLVALDLFVSGENGYHTYRIPALVKF